MKPFHKNPRQISKTDHARLTDTLIRLGDLSGIVHNLNTDEIIGGNQRMTVFTDGKPEIVETYDNPDEQGTVAHGFIVWKGHKFAYRQVRWDDKTSDEANIAANIGGGDWDWEVIANQWSADDLQGWGMDSATLKEWKHDVSALDNFIESEKKEPVDAEPQTDRAAELNEKWQVKTGDLWQIGEHRLLCGDSTKEQDINKLMGGDKAVCMWTDPPYGVEYVGKTKDALTIENDGAENLPELLSSAFLVADSILEEGAPIYVAHPPGALQMVFDKCFVDVGWRFHETLVWVKDSMVMGHSDYHYKHEPIIYGWKGKNRFWYSGRDQVSVFEIARPKRSSEHPTMKPPELVEACLYNSTTTGDITFEPFAGSGTTMVACHNIKRRCYANELSPNYCAVILERMSTAFPELEIKRLNEQTNDIN